MPTDDEHSNDTVVDCSDLEFGQAVVGSALIGAGIGFTTGLYLSVRSGMYGAIDRYEFEPVVRDAGHVGETTAPYPDQGEKADG
ncbi:MAG: hypothetical protein AAF809_07950 [Bacteroidota bacterium]